MGEGLIGLAYFVVDDQLHSHPKAKAAGLAAMGLWTLAGSYCRAYKSDGFVPEWWITEKRGKREAQRLVDAGLWHPCVTAAGVGYVFHDWDDVHDPSDVIEQQRERGRERQRKRRARIREERGTNA